jgi:hypothetical protein
MKYIFILAHLPFTNAALLFSSLMQFTARNDKYKNVSENFSAETEFREIEPKAI